MALTCTSETLRSGQLALLQFLHNQFQLHHLAILSTVMHVVANQMMNAMAAVIADGRGQSMTLTNGPLRMLIADADKTTSLLNELNSLS